MKFDNHHSTSESLTCICVIDIVVEHQSRRKDPPVLPPPVGGGGLMHAQGPHVAYENFSFSFQCFQNICEDIRA